MAYKTDFSKIDLEKYYFDERAADLAVRYIEKNIKHVKGELAGKPVILEEWQKNEIIRPLFGWKHIETGFRKYTNTYIEIPKKNGKTALAAAVAAIFLDIEAEKGEVPIFSIAGNRDQARLSFDDTKGYVMQSQRLKSKARVFRNSIMVGEPPNVKYFKPMSRDSKTQEGINPQLAIVDELHVHPNSDLIENMEKSMVSRRQPLSFVITTAGNDLYGIGYQRHEYAIDVVKGVLTDETLLVCIYCADEDDDPFAEETWAKANPNYGVSVYKAALEREANKAKQSTASLNHFLRYHLNIWTATKTAWIADHLWAASHWEFDVETLKGRECYAGLDLSARSDFTALSLIFPIEDKYISLNYLWAPEAGHGTTDERNNIRFEQWKKQGYLEEMYTDNIRHDDIRAKINQLSQEYDIQIIAYDPFFSGNLIADLEQDGHDLFKFTQKWEYLNYPTVKLEELIQDKRFNHLGNPVLRWMASNCVVATDTAGNLKKVIKDKRKPHQKIDGIVSNIMGLGMAINNQIQEKGSYLEGGKLTII